MSIDVSRNSWTNLSALRSIDRLEFWELPTFQELDERRDDDRLYRVQHHDRIDNLAHTFYGDPGLWWVLAQVNDLRLLPCDLKPGRTLKIPSQRFINELLKLMP